MRPVAPVRSLASCACGFLVAAGQGVMKAHARRDPELGEHLAQVPLDRPGADEQPRADLWVGEPFAGEARDLLLLRGELVAGVVSALPPLLAGCEQLSSGAMCESCGSHRGEHVVRLAQLLTGIHPPVL